MNGYREYSKDIWDYLRDMPYMPTRADRDGLLANDPDRVQLWDYFFRIKPEDLGKPQKEEIKEIEECTLQEISTHNQRQNEIAEAIRENRRILFWRRFKNILYGGGCFALTILTYRFVINNHLGIDWLIGCTSPFFTFGLTLWLTIPIVGRDEKREIRDLRAQSVLLHELHAKSLKAKVERKNFLKSEIKELKKKIPKPPPDIDVHRWFTEHLDIVVEDSKRETGLLSSVLIEAWS